MTVPMPKDNEVDEKVMPVAWIVTNGGESCEPWLEYEQSEVDALPAVCIAEPLYSAATVAELRAKVKRLDACIDAIHENWMNYGPHREIVARADAAERRVGELEKLMAAARRAIGDHHAPNDCYATGPLTGDEFLDLVQCPACAFLEQHEALTGADPT